MHQVMEVKSNLVKEERAQLLKRFTEGYFKTVAQAAAVSEMDWCLQMTRRPFGRYNGANCFAVLEETKRQSAVLVPLKGKPT